MMREYPILQAVTQMHEAKGVADAAHNGQSSLDGMEWMRGGVPPRWAAGMAASQTTPAPRNALAKRVLDIVVALFVLLLTLPFYPLILLAIRLDSPGPALFRQVRAGKDGRPFIVYKFRSMHYSPQATDPLYQRIATSWLDGKPLAEGLQELAAHDDHNEGHSGDGDGPLPRKASLSGAKPRAPIKYKLKDDPRITRVGRFLRMTSVDELPQFLNVLRGEMSVVGPRPAIPYEVDRYSPRDFGRLLVKPGITGLWQVKARGHVSFQQMIELDLEYTANNSFWQDLVLILRTIPAVLFARGAA